jgi:hypothetical protein
MSWKALIISSMLVGTVAALAQRAPDHELARRLADQNTRQAAVAEIMASEQPRDPLLLSWTRNPPHEVDRYKL